MAYKNNNEHFKIHTIPLAQKKIYNNEKITAKKKKPTTKTKNCIIEINHKDLTGREAHIWRYHFSPKVMATVE